MVFGAKPVEVWWLHADIGVGTVVIYPSVDCEVDGRDTNFCYLNEVQFP